MASGQTIEVDEITAKRLEARARELGLSVSELVAGLTTLEPVEVSDDVLADLDGIVDAIEAGRRGRALACDLGHAGL